MKAAAATARVGRARAATAWAAPGAVTAAARVQSPESGRVRSTGCPRRRRQGAANAPRIVAGTVLIVQKVKCVAALASVGDRGLCDFRGALSHSERQGLAGAARAKARPSGVHCRKVRALPKGTEPGVVRWRRRRHGWRHGWRRRIARATVTRAVVVVVVGASPSRDRTVLFERREYGTGRRWPRPFGRCREDGGVASVSGRPGAAVLGAAPGSDRTVLLECREGSPVRVPTCTVASATGHDGES